MPNKDYKALNIHRNVSIEALLRGDVDAVAIGSSHLFNIRDKFTDVGLRVAARGPDLPNDVLVAGAHVPAANVAKMRDAFVNNAEKLLNAALRGEENKKYRGGKFIPTVKDFDYEYVRQAYITVGAESLAKFIDE
jgi:phosphonate transport system substrate-binding protein